MKTTIAVEVPVEVHTERRLPGHYEAVGGFADHPIHTVGQSVTHPFVYYLLGERGPQATVNVVAVFEALAERWPLARPGDGERETR